MAKQPKAPKTEKTAKQPKAPEPKGDGLVDAIVAKDFTSTILGNLSPGQKIRISPSRYEQWKTDGMVK